MTGYPSLGVALLQGLITAAVMLGPWLLIAFGGRTRMTWVDLGLLLVTIPAAALFSAIIFWPFEGDWLGVVLGPFEPFRMMVIGGLVLMLGTAVTQRHGLARRGNSEGLVRLGAAFLIGAAWGTVWGFAGWCLFKYGMLGDG